MISVQLPCASDRITSRRTQMANPKLPEPVDAPSLDEFVRDVLNVPAEDVPNAEEEKQLD